MRCKEVINESILPENKVQIVKKKNVASKLKCDNGKNEIVFTLDVPEKHSQMKNIPKANLALLRPKNEESEKEKFRGYYAQFLKMSDKSKAKIYNPRFAYSDNIKAQQVVSDMRAVFSTKYRTHSK